MAAGAKRIIRNRLPSGVTENRTPADNSQPRSNNCWGRLTDNVDPA